MKIAHLSDVHLGYRDFNRTDPTGINQRQKDVEQAFVNALKVCLEIEPDLIIIAGDLFHAVRPTNYTVVAAFNHLARFQDHRNHKPLLIVAGNHETPKTAEAGNILALFRNIRGITVVTDRIERVRLEEFGASVLCVPSRGVRDIQPTSLAPDPKSAVNLLCVHGPLQDVGRYRSDSSLPQSHVIKAGWDYIALGDYHVFQQLSPNACYSGSTEYTTTNIWEELTVSKVVVEYDTDTKALTKHEIPQARKFLDLPIIDASGLEPAEVLEAMVGNAKEIDDAVARQKIVEIDFEKRRRVSGEIVRQLKSRALHYKMIFEAPHSLSVAAGRSLTHGRTLEESWSEFMATAELPKTIDRRAVVALGTKYLQEAAE
ncbi:MAG: metallophosphoesterase [Armatimonadetes bacterium]|nr:metallophosphoesterase [Armatimonadota bacterium]